MLLFSKTVGCRTNSTDVRLIFIFINSCILAFLNAIEEKSAYVYIIYIILTLAQLISKLNGKPNIL